jgi:very-short-patch-repair endonuclease
MRSKRSFPKMRHRAGELRQQMTPAEKRLWAALRNHQLGGTSFRRSHAIGPYIADFCAPRQKLIIELDGEPHRTQQEADAERTQYLASLGYTVIRFWNSQVLDDLSEVLTAIESVVCAHN